MMLVEVFLLRRHREGCVRLLERRQIAWLDFASSLHRLRSPTGILLWLRAKTAGWSEGAQRLPGLQRQGAHWRRRLLLLRRLEHRAAHLPLLQNPVGVRRRLRIFRHHHQAFCGHVLVELQASLDTRVLKRHARPTQGTLFFRL